MTGQELCEGIRQLALKAFGPMVPTVFEYWGVRKTDDFGEMVWKLITSHSAERDARTSMRILRFVKLLP